MNFSENKIASHKIGSIIKISNGLFKIEEDKEGQIWGLCSNCSLNCINCNSSSIYKARGYCCVSDRTDNKSVHFSLLKTLKTRSDLSIFRFEL